MKSASKTGWLKRMVALVVCLAGCGPASAVDRRDTANPFGVLDFLPWDHEWNNHHYGGDQVEKSVALMKEAGVGFVRMDFLWNDIEPARGKFDFEKYDRIVASLDRAGIKILGLLNYNAGWAAPNWNDAPDPELFSNYAEKVVRRYKKSVKYWEIWNEPDFAVYWTPQDEMKSYVGLLKTVYPRIKKEDPTARVVLGGLSQNIPFQLKRVYAHGGGPFFDTVSIHPFSDPSRPERVDHLRNIYLATRKVMEANDDTAKGIWITELGCPGVNDPTVPGWWFGTNPSEETQAKWVEEAYQALAWEGVEKVFWAFFRDTPQHFKNGIDYFGLVRTDFSKKPSFDAYQSLTKKWVTGQSDL